MLTPNSTRLLSLFALLAGAALFANSASANNVILEREGRSLHLYGDANANAIVISQRPNNRVVVSGIGATTINSLPRVIVDNIDLLELEINTFGGNDRVRLNDLSVAGEVSVNLGDGIDRFLSGAVPCDIGGELEVIGGDGRDIVLIDNWMVAGDVSIVGNDGTLNARLSNLIVGGELEIVGNQFADFIRVTGAAIGGEIDVRTSVGNDRVVLQDITSRAIDIVTTAGDEVVSLRRVSTDLFLEVATGGGDDRVILDEVLAGTFIEVFLSAGNDDLIGIDVFAPVEAFFNGGGGSDLFFDLGVDSTGLLRVIGFEVLQ